MKLALVVPPPHVTSAVGEYAQSLLPHLEELMQVTLFDEESVGTLNPRNFDQVLYIVGDEACCAFMVPALRAIGGTVDLFAWNLGQLANAIWPELQRGGMRARLRRLREGRDLNRSIVRHGDAFIVRDECLAGQILEDRNASTPIAKAPRDDKGAIAARYLEILESFPAPRTARRPILYSIIQEADRRRAERDKQQSESP